MDKPWGMAPSSWTSLMRACEEANIKLSPQRVTQTIGHAQSSAGFHAQDGTVVVNGVSYPYCAAVDLSIFHPDKLTKKQILRFLKALAKHGFVAWYRYRGSFAKNQHIHAVDVNLPMKEALQKQVQDFLHDRTGLAGHELEPFWTAPQELDNFLRAGFLHANPI